jgi:exopolyphosphatase/guanosine-5'-triphosphate,3'-diphosphate pyrophosphatase
MEKATLAARLELQTVERRFRDIGWSDAVGSSGTIRAVASVLAAQGWGDKEITRDGLRRLRKALVSAGSVSELHLEGLKPERARVFPGGVAILRAIFRGLGIERMTVSSGALREGVMYDLLGRIRHEDVRERTIHLFQQRYQVDLGQAARVRRTAIMLLRQVATAWNLDEGEAGRHLAWAAQLHEVGLAMSYEHYHRHGAYIVANSDMPGFSRDDQQVLATLLVGHRRKLKLLTFVELPGPRASMTRRLLVLLRLAVLLNRGRSPNPRPDAIISGSKKKLKLALPAEWLDEHPLTRLDLKSEASHLRALEVELMLEECDGNA